MSIPADPDALRTSDALSTIQRQLSEAISRLTDASARAARVADQTDWRTDAATRFHASADDWRRDVAALPDVVESAREEVARARTRFEALAWGFGG
jgi:uncharacterized protein YukE